MPTYQAITLHDDEVARPLCPMCWRTLRAWLYGRAVGGAIVDLLAGP